MSSLGLQYFIGSPLSCGHPNSSYRTLMICNLSSNNCPALFPTSFSRHYPSYGLLGQATGSCPPGLLHLLYLSPGTLTLSCPTTSAELTSHPSIISSKVTFPRGLPFTLYSVPLLYAPLLCISLVTMFILLSCDGSHGYPWNPSKKQYMVKKGEQNFEEAIIESIGRRGLHQKEDTTVKWGPKRTYLKDKQDHDIDLSPKGRTRALSAQDMCSIDKSKIWSLTSVIKDQKYKH